MLLLWIYHCDKGQNLLWFWINNFQFIQRQVRKLEKLVWNLILVMWWLKLESMVRFLFLSYSYFLILFLCKQQMCP